jgi:hypothetical protein
LIPAGYNNTATPSRFVFRFVCLAFVAAAAVVGYAFPLSAHSVDFKGELAAAVTANDTDPKPVYFGIRYFPELFAGYSISESTTLDIMGSLDARWTTRLDSLDDAHSDEDLDAYRLWIRLNAAQLETRLGLQKISFGVATLFRPLMWFDSIDPRDPLRITDGVWGLLLRYYFVNNANVWVWGLLGNEDPKGWELLPTVHDIPEYGGRLQVPVPRGEVALSYHHRTIDGSEIATLPQTAGDSEIPEDRIGVDAKWDVKLGLWLEGSLVHQDSELIPESYQHFLTAGFDYTFGLGEGLTFLAEHFLVSSSDKAFGTGERSDVTGVSVTYPWGALDALALILYYDYEADELYSFVDLRRRYDRWTFHIIAFANPDSFALPTAVAENTLLVGNGLQFLVVFNH